MKPIRNLILFFFVLSLGTLPLLADRPGEPFSFYHSDPTIVNSWPIELEMRPGDMVTQEVIVQNQSTIDGDGVYELYAAGTSTSSGAVPAKTEAQSDFGKWVTFSPSTLTLAKDQKGKSSFTVKVPLDAKENLYSGFLVASWVIPESEKKMSGTGAIVTTRSALNIHVKVTNTPTTTLSRTAEEVTAEQAEGGGRYLTPLNIILGVVLLALLVYLLKTFVFGKPSKKE